MKFLAIALLIAVSVTFSGLKAANASIIVKVGQPFPVASITCLTDADKNTMRTLAASNALEHAWNVYKTANPTVSDDMRYDPATLKAYAPAAVKVYRTFLMRLGHRYILTQGAGCTRDVVAFIKTSTGDISLYTEEELLAQYDEVATDQTGAGVVGYNGGFDGTPSGYEAAAIAVGLVGMAGTILQTTTPTVTSVIMQILGYTLAAALALGSDIDKAIQNGGGFGSSAGDRER